MGGIPLSVWSGSGATEELHKTIKAFVESSEKQSRIMIRLTWSIVVLTVILTIGLAIQIYLLIGNPP